MATCNYCSHILNVTKRSRTVRLPAFVSRCTGALANIWSLPFGKGDLWMIMLTLVVHKKFYAHLEPIGSWQIRKVMHSLVSTSHHILSILWGLILGVWSGEIHSQLAIFVAFASILSAQHNFGLRLLFRWHGIGKTGSRGVNNIRRCFTSHHSIGFRRLLVADYQSQQISRERPSFYLVYL